MILYAENVLNVRKHTIKLNDWSIFQSLKENFFEPVLRAKHYLDCKIRLTDISQQQYEQ